MIQNLLVRQYKLETAIQNKEVARVYLLLILKNPYGMRCRSMLLLAEKEEALRAEIEEMKRDRSLALLYKEVDRLAHKVEVLEHKIEERPHISVRA